MTRLLIHVLFFSLLDLTTANFKCHRKIDMVVILDCSASTTEERFEKAKRFTKELVNYFDISKDKTNVALASFSQYVHTARKFSDEASSESVFKGVDGLFYEGSVSRLDFALDAVQNDLLRNANSARNMNTDVKKVVLFITDGFSSRGIEITKDSTDVLKRQGVKLFSVSFADRVHKSELDELTSTPLETHQLIFHSKTPFTIDQVKKLAKEICEGE